MMTAGKEGCLLEENLNTENSRAEAPAQNAQPEALIHKAGRLFRISSLIYFLGALQMAAGAVLGVVGFFIILARSGTYAYSYGYYRMAPMASGFIRAFAVGLGILVSLFVSGTITLGFGKMVQASEIYIQRRTKKQQ